jgi:intein/homing endonuclease
MKDIYGGLFQNLPFRTPPLSEALAEFIGIMMGDGSLTPNQLTITLHYINDHEYGIFVIKLIEFLFDLSPGVFYDRKFSVNRITIARIKLMKYLHNLGLPIGNKIKQNIDIPQWIKERREYRVACLRGLVDTDGCVFTHSYFVNGTRYHYKKLDFTSMSQPLLKSVDVILRDVGFHPRLVKGRGVRLDRVEDVRNYIRIVGSHNPKHLNRYYG